MTEMSPDIRDANEALFAAFAKVGYITNPVSGVIDGTAVHDRRGDYLFAWHRNPNHLLFYIRHPALDRQTTLRQSALHHHGDKVNRNPGGETTITLDSSADAELLLSWLSRRLPLP